MKQGFVLFGLRDNSGCTTNAIHIARYFASGGYSVALVESANIKSPCLRDYVEGEKIPYEKDGVTIYPTWDQEVPDTDIMVYDMGAISIAKALRITKHNFEFIICANADEDTLFDLSEALINEARQLNPLVLLKECGDMWVAKFKAINFRTFKVGYSTTTCPTVLADNLIQVCHFGGILPPDINYDLEAWSSTINTEPSKKVLFGGRNKKKAIPEEKLEDIIIDAMIPDISLGDEGLRYDEDGLPIPEEIEYSGIKAHARDKSLKKKPDKIYTSQKEFETEQGCNKAEESDKTDVKEKLKNTIDSAADVSKTILTGISRFAKKVMPEKILDNKKSEETEVTLTEEDHKVQKYQQKKEESTEDKASKSSESGVKYLYGKVANPFKGGEEDPGYLNIKIDRETVDMILSEENTAVAETNYTKEKDSQSKIKFVGHLTVFVTALKHGAGSSHVAGIIGSALVASNNIVCFVHKKGTEYPNNKNMCEYIDTNFEESYNIAKTIVIDRGCLGELTRNELVEMQRADIKVLVCGSSESDFQALARFIHKAGTASGKWLYVFNHVSSKKKRDLIKDLMQEYDYIFLQMCDYDEAPKDILDMWNKQIKKKLK